MSGRGAIGRLPNFLFIGPDKTGSSWLFEVLAQHPDCHVPAAKDLYFFDRHYHRGLGWYRRFFRDAPPHSIAVGELSHDYLFSPVAAARIARDLPGVRLITCLRDPVERTFSHYLYMRRSGLTRLSFEDALRRFPDLTGNSLYHRHLLLYRQLFDDRRLLVLEFDQLQASPPAFARRVFEFLGLAFIDGIDYQRRVRAAARPRSYLLAKLARRGAEAARGLGFTELVGAVKHGPLAQRLYETYPDGARPRMQDETRRSLTRLFMPDIERLELALGREFSAWKRSA